MLAKLFQACKTMLVLQLTTIYLAQILHRVCGKELVDLQLLGKESGEQMPLSYSREGKIGCNYSQGPLHHSSCRGPSALAVCPQWSAGQEKKGGHHGLPEARAFRHADNFTSKLHFLPYSLIGCASNLMLFYKLLHFLPLPPT